MTPTTYELQPSPNAKNSWPVGLPVLAGPPGETLFAGARPAGVCGNYELEQSGRWVIGRASLPARSGCEAAARDLYRELFGAVGRLSLCRVWNFVPAINAAGPDGLENYRAFCRGRSLAFEQALGPAFERQLPAASAVGTDDDRLTVVFAASAVSPQLFENPEQVAAYSYPEKYGPRPPSFSRAARVPGPGGRADVFVSGTAAVTGSETVCPGDTEGQIAATLRNLRLVSEACGLGSSLGRGRAAERHFKVYLRNAADSPRVRAALDQELLAPDDRVVYLRADICRADLNLEIEATVLGVGVAAGD